MGGLIATLRKPLAIARVGRGGGAGPDTVAAGHVDSKLPLVARSPFISSSSFFCVARKH